MILATVLAAASVAAPASVPAPPEAVAGLSAVALFTVAAQAEKTGDRAAAEAIYRALVADPNLPIRNEAQFRLSKLREAAGDRVGSAVLLRAILDEEPTAARVRLELARLLFLTGDQRAALRELRAAEAGGGLPPEVATAVNQFVGALRSQKPFGLSLEVAFAPDSNVNRATTADTLDTIIAPLVLDRNAQATSGVGLKGGLQGYIRFPVGTRIGVLARASTQAHLYRDGRFDDIIGSAQIGFEWMPGGMRLSPSFGRSWRWYGGEAYAVTDTLSLNARRAVGKRSQIDVDLAAGRASYLRNPLQSGHIFDASVSLERAFSSRSGGSVTLSVQRQTAADRGYALVSGGVSLLAWREIGRATAFATATVRRLETDARIFLYTDRRRETYWRLGGGATWRGIQVAGFSPVVRVAWERNASTIVLYDYNRMSAEIGVSRAF